MGGETPNGGTVRSVDKSMPGMPRGVHEGIVRAVVARMQRRGGSDGCAGHGKADLNGMPVGRVDIKVWVDRVRVNGHKLVKSGMGQACSRGVVPL
jgi:hypothetical protein